MNKGQKNSSLTLAAKPASSDHACRLCGIKLKFQLVIFAERTSTFQLKIYSPQRAGIDKIHLEDLLKIHLGFEVDPQDGKSFHK